MARETTDERIDAEEVRLGRTLPASLRARLLEENGGEIETDEPFEDDWELHGVADLIHGKKGRSWPGEGLTEFTAKEIKDWGDAWEMPEGVVCMAGNGSGDLLLLLPDNRYAVRDHETRELILVGVRLQVDEGEFVTEAV